MAWPRWPRGKRLDQPLIKKAFPRWGVNPADSGTIRPEVLRRKPRGYRKFLGLAILVLLVPIFAAMYSPTVARTLLGLYDDLSYWNDVANPFVINRISAEELDRLVRKAGTAHGVDHRLIKAVIRVESSFEITAVSPRGARGLMQLMPATAKDLKVSDPDDPWENINGGSKYLARLIRHFKGDLKLALAAYNAGPMKVKQYNGVPPFPETQRFVKRVLHTYSSYKKAES